MTSAAKRFETRTIGIAALVAVCLYISGLFVIFTPLPIIYVTTIKGRKNGLSSAVIAFICVGSVYFLSSVLHSVFIPLPAQGLTSHFSLFTVAMIGICYFLFFISIGVIIGEAIINRWGLVKSGAYAVIMPVSILAVVMSLVNFSGSLHILTGIRGYLEFMVSEVARFQQSAGVSGAQVDLLNRHGGEIAAFIFNVLPSLIFVFALIAVVINLLLSKRFIRLPSILSPTFWNMASFRIADVVIWGVIVGAAVFFIGQYLLHREWLRFIGINALITLAALYFFQGLAIIAFFVKKIKTPILKILLYVSIMVFFQTVGVLVVGLGLADVWVDFRKRAKLIEKA